MKKFLSVILRNQFNLFYRFGYTYIPKDYLVEFDGKINEQIKGQVIDLFAKLSPFEWDEEYLIIQIEKNIGENYFMEIFHIQDLVSIFPLSLQAKVSIESKFDTRIKLENPIFEDILPSIEKNIQKHEIEKAIIALWKICELEGDPAKYISNINIEKIFKGIDYRKQGVKSFNIKEGDYWEYLIAYERYDYFPNSILGYFFDAGQVFAYSKGLQTFEGSEIYKFLEHLNNTNPNIKIKDTIDLLESELRVESYISQNKVNNIKQYFVAPIFFMLRDEIRKADDIYRTYLFLHLESLRKFGDNFIYAIILLGAFFGFKKFYDVYYDKLNLKFFKTQITGVKSKGKLAKDTREKDTHIKNHLVVRNLEPSIKDIAEKTNKTLIKKDNVVESPNNHSTTIENKALDTLSSIVFEYQNIIRNIMEDKNECKLSDIKKIIKDKTKKDLNHDGIKNVIAEMNDIESFKRDKTDMARRILRKKINPPEQLNIPL